MGLIKEFRDFALKGNVIDLAVAVIIGAAFSKIIQSLVSDVITPLLLQPALNAAHLSSIENLVAFGSVKYGLFLANVIHFLMVAFVLFLTIKALNKVKRKKDEEKAIEVVLPSKEEALLTEIRDLLKNKK